MGKILVISPKSQEFPAGEIAETIVQGARVRKGNYNFKPRTEMGEYKVNHKKDAEYEDRRGEEL